jgi:hypothetical protein
MDVLARRKTGGKITGEILVNGRPTDANLSRVIGYVEQQDLHVPTQTILEAIEFSAFVRSLPSNVCVCVRCACTNIALALSSVVCLTTSRARPRRPTHGACSGSWAWRRRPTV